MAQRAIVHFKWFGIPTEIILEPVDVITERGLFDGTPREWLVGYDDYGLPRRIRLDKIVKTEPAPPSVVAPRQTEPQPDPQIMAPSWKSY